MEQKKESIINGPFYISIASDRSANAIQDGSDDIETYCCTTHDPSDSNTFDLWANTSESMVGEFETVQDIIDWFESEMSERPTQTNSDDDMYNPSVFDAEDIKSAFESYDFESDRQHSYCGDDGVIFSFTAYASPFENDFYTISDPDGSKNDWQDIYPMEKEGVSILWGIDGGTSTRVNHCDLWDILLGIDDVEKFVNANFGDDSWDDLSDLAPGNALWDEFIEILENNDYETDHCQSPGHLDSTSSPGTGNVYDYVFIKKTA